MKPSEIMFDKSISNRDKFGYYVRERRLELGITLRAFAECLGFSPAYISDIEKGNRKAPAEHLDKFAVLLGVEESELEYFVDIAGCSHSNWPDINEYLAQNKGARDFIRMARDKGLTAEEFLEIVNKLAEEQEVKEVEK